MPFVYTTPADQADARRLLEHVDVELEALHRQQVDTPFGVLTSHWDGEKLTISGELKRPAARKVWNLVFRPYGPVIAWGSDVAGEPPTRAQWRIIGTLLSDLHDWQESCQDRTLAVAGHAMTVRPFLVAMTERPQETAQFGPISMALFQRSLDALTVAALPGGSPQRELALQLLRDQWTGSVTELLDAADLLAASA